MEEEWEAYKYGAGAPNILKISHVQNLKSSQTEKDLDAGA